jgi:hypothetical protein
MVGVKKVANPGLCLGVAGSDKRWFLIPRIQQNTKRGAARGGFEGSDCAKTLVTFSDGEKSLGSTNKMLLLRCNVHIVQVNEYFESLYRCPVSEEGVIFMGINQWCYGSRAITARNQLFEYSSISRYHLR